MQVKSIRDSPEDESQARGQLLLHSRTFQYFVDEGVHDPAAVEAEKRLLDLNRRIIATAACHSQLPDSSQSPAALKVAAEAFSWDQASVSS